MNTVKNKHQKYEALVNKTMVQETPSMLTDEAEFVSLLDTRPSFESLISYTMVVKQALEAEYPNEDVRLASYKFSGYYHNTVINHTTHWGEMVDKVNYRTVIVCGDIHLEFKEMSDTSVELWCIKINRSARGSGLGKDVMTLLQDIAEAKELDLLLVACSQGEPNYNMFIKRTIQLRKWYYELGFEAIENSAYMVF